MNSRYPKRIERLNGFFNCRFSIYSNERHKMRYFIDDQERKLDFNINDYDVEIQAYLEKRWTKKHEIEPKIYIIKPIMSLISTLEQQKLMNFTTLMGDDRLLNLSKTAEIDTKYIASVCCEPHFKGMLDEYLRKIVVNGRVVPMNEYQDYDNIRRKVLGLYRKFFYGDNVSFFERNIEKKYLAAKQKKWMRYLANKKLTMNKCVWTYNEQKCLEGFRNWRTRNLGLYDDFRPLFDFFPESNEVLNKKHTYLDRLLKKNQQEIQYIASVLLSRTIAYCCCPELISNMRIPPDYQIEICVVNFHLSILQSQLMKKKDSISFSICHKLDQLFEEYSKDKFIKFRVSDVSLNVSQTIRYLKKIRSLSVDFCLAYPLNGENLNNLAKMIKRVVFLNKRGISKESILLFTFYAHSNLQYLNRLDFSQIITQLEWDTYRIPFELLEKEVILEEKNEPESFFSQNLRKLDNLKEMGLQNQQRIPLIYNRLFKLLRKFTTMNSYDYFNEREEVEKKQKKKAQKYFWKDKEKEEPIKP